MSSHKTNIVNAPIIEIEKYKSQYIKDEVFNELALINKVEVAKIELDNNKEELDSSNDLGTFNVSWYTSKCKGCSGITATGINVKNSVRHEGYNVAASDWSIIPRHSIIEVEGYGEFIIEDRGGAIKGRRLDLLISTKKEAYSNGRQYLNVKIIRWGKGE